MGPFRILRPVHLVARRGLADSWPGFRNGVKNEAGVWKNVESRSDVKKSAKNWHFFYVLEWLPPII